MFITRPFSAEALKLHPFSCGEPELDEWLVRYAGQNERKDNTRTTLLLDEHVGVLAGYFTMRTFELSPADAESATGRRHRYPVPAMLIARLAVDSAYQGRGVGKLLLLDALQRLRTTADSVGFELVVVHALHEDAACFYLKHGFRRFLDHELSLFMTTKALRVTFDATDPA